MLPRIDLLPILLGLVRSHGHHLLVSSKEEPQHVGYVSMSRTPNPHTVALTRLLDPLGRCLTPDVAKELVNLRADPRVQARLEELADKNTEGVLTPEERDEYETSVHVIEFIAVLQAKARTILARNGG